MKGRPAIWCKGRSKGVHALCASIIYTISRFSLIYTYFYLAHGQVSVLPRDRLVPYLYPSDIHFRVRKSNRNMFTYLYLFYGQR